MSLEFYFFHLMPYPDVMPYLDDYESSWVVFPNKHYDPVIGNQLYNRYLDELEYAEKLGYDGICVNEHHQNCYGLMPSPNVMAACLVRRTNRMKIVLLGNGIPLRDHPTRVAEEVAMLDVISGGRIVSGFVRGIGCEYHSLNVDPSRSRERFNEAHDLIVKSWTEPEPFQWVGKHYKLRHVNVWPRPFQNPHPPIWVPGFGSPETFRWVAEQRYTWMSLFAPFTQIKRWADQFRGIARDEFGYELEPRQIAMSMPIYVAETDERAHEEGRQHVEWLYHRGLKHKWEFLVPPGYLSQNALRGMMRADFKSFQETTYEELIEKGYAIVGSPETVRQRLEEAREALGMGLVVAVLQLGDMPFHRTMKNIELFAKEVIPHFKDGTERPAAVDAAAVAA